MPTNTASSYRGDAGLDTRLRKVEDDVRQLRERATRPQKIPAATGGGGVTGVTRLTAGSIVQSNAASPVGSSVTFADLSISPLFGDAVSVTEGANGQFTLGTAGFYMCRALVRMAWSGGATLDEVRASADYDQADPYPLWFRKLGSVDGLGGTPSLRDTFEWGPFEVDDGGWTSFGLNWLTADTAFLSAACIDVWRVG